MNGSHVGYENPEYGNVGPSSMPNPNFENPVYDSIDGMPNPGKNQCHSTFSCKATISETVATLDIFHVLYCSLLTILLYLLLDDDTCKRYCKVNVITRP